MRINFEDFKKECAKNKYKKVININMGDGYVALLQYRSNYINSDEMTYSVDILYNDNKIGRCPYNVSFCRNNQIVKSVYGCYCNILNTINTKC